MRKGEIEREKQMSRTKDIGISKDKYVHRWGFLTRVGEKL